MLKAIQHTQDPQQLQQLVQAPSTPLTAAHVAAAFRSAAQLGGGRDRPSAGPLLEALRAAWGVALPSAGGAELAGALLALAKMQLQDEALWGDTLAAVPGQIKLAEGRDLANIAYALASMSVASGGSVPGMGREEVRELVRQLTHELVSLVSGAAAGAGGRPVSASSMATLRWAHEVFEELDST